MLVAQEIQNSGEFGALCKSVKDAIVNILKTELVPDLVTIGERTPKIENRLLYDQKSDTWAAMLRSQRHVVTIADRTEKKVHCYMVASQGIGGYENNVNRTMPFSLRFLILSYYQSDVGVDGDNSEDHHAYELSKIAYAINNTPKLNCPGVVADVKDYRERREPTRIGDVMAQESVIEFAVELQPVPKKYH